MEIPPYPISRPQTPFYVQQAAPPSICLLAIQLILGGVTAPRGGSCQPHSVLPCGVPHNPPLPPHTKPRTQALRDAGGLRPGGSVCIVGASGGCGSAGLALARLLVGPSGTVAAICGTDSVPDVQVGVDSGNRVCFNRVC